MYILKFTGITNFRTYGIDNFSLGMYSSMNISLCREETNLQEEGPWTKEAEEGQERRQPRNRG